MSLKDHFQLVGKPTCCKPEDPFAITASHVASQKNRRTEIQFQLCVIGGDLAMCYIPTINHSAYGEVKKIWEYDTKTKRVVKYDTKTEFGGSTRT